MEMQGAKSVCWKTSFQQSIRNEAIIAKIQVRQWKRFHIIGPQGSLTLSPHSIGNGSIGTGDGDTGLLVR